jgi:hypothetical protein
MHLVLFALNYQKESNGEEYIILFRSSLYRGPCSHEHERECFEEVNNTNITQGWVFFVCALSENHFCLSYLNTKFNEFLVCHRADNIHSVVAIVWIVNVYKGPGVNILVLSL